MSERLARKVLLVGWDAADWKVIKPLLDAGQMPSLDGLISCGVMGNLASLEPMLSPMLWTSIATGKRADKHGIHGFVEPDPDTGSIRPVASTSRQVKAIWNILSQQSIPSAVLGWFASHPAEPIHGACVSNRYYHATAAPGEPWPLPPGTVHPPRLEKVLAELRVHPGELTGDHLLPFVPGAGRVDQANDKRLAVLAKLLAECTSVHAAATWVMEHEPWEFLAVYYDAIDHFSHAFMPYHSPRLPGVPEEDFELYKDVVAGAYRYSDMMLGRLLGLAGPETTVVLVSDHGFHCDHLRPRGPVGRPGEWPVSWHRPFGAICMKGPHVRADELIYGASLLDVTPTLLTLFGLPVGEDMDGRPLLQAFDRPVAVDRIPTWEEVPGACGMHPSDLRQDPWEAREVLRQLAALGYLDAPAADLQKAQDEVARDRKWNLARVYLHSRRPAEAAALLEQLHAEQPDDSMFALHLAQCRLDQGNLPECRRLVERVLTRREGRPRADLLMRTLCFLEGRAEQALGHLLEAEKTEPRLPTLHCRIGNVYLRTGRWEDAERAFGTALEIDGDSAEAHNGLAMAFLQQRRYEEAADAALLAVGLLHHFPQAHFHLGVALAQVGEPERAILALETCLTMSPQTQAAHRWLAALHGQVTGHSVRAARHSRLADELSASRHSLPAAP